MYQRLGEGSDTEVIVKQAVRSQRQQGQADRSFIVSIIQLVYESPVKAHARVNYTQKDKGVDRQRNRHNYRETDIITEKQK